MASWRYIHFTKTSRSLIHNRSLPLSISCTSWVAIIYKRIFYKIRRTVQTCVQQQKNPTSLNIYIPHQNTRSTLPTSRFLFLTDILSINHLTLASTNCSHKACPNFTQSTSLVYRFISSSFETAHSLRCACSVNRVYCCPRTWPFSPERCTFYIVQRIWTGSVWPTAATE